MCGAPGQGSLVRAGEAGGATSIDTPEWRVVGAYVDALCSVLFRRACNACGGRHCYSTQSKAASVRSASVTDAAAYVNITREETLDVKPIPFCTVPSCGDVKLNVFSWSLRSCIGMGTVGGASLTSSLPGWMRDSFAVNAVGCA